MRHINTIYFALTFGMIAGLGVTAFAQYVLIPTLLSNGFLVGSAAPALATLIAG